MNRKNGARWDLLAVEVRARREWLQLSHHGVAKRGGPSHETVRLVEAQGRERFRNLTLSQLDRGLGWRQGTARSIVDGTATRDRAQWEATPDEVRVPVGGRHDPEGMSPLPLSLDNVSDLELAGEMVARLTRGPNAGANRRLLAELTALMTRLYDKPDDVADAAAS